MGRVWSRIIHYIKNVCVPSWSGRKRMFTGTDYVCHSDTHTHTGKKTTAIKHKKNTQELLFQWGMKGVNTEERRGMRENVQ